MEILLWTAIAVLLCIVAALSLKIFLMKNPCVQSAGNFPGGLPRIQIPL